MTIDSFCWYWLCLGCDNCCDNRCDNATSVTFGYIVIPLVTSVACRKLPLSQVKSLFMLSQLLSHFCRFSFLVAKGSDAVASITFSNFCRLSQIAIIAGKKLVYVVAIVVALLSLFVFGC